MSRNYSETSMISIPADKNNKAIILDVGGKKHKIRGAIIFLSDISKFHFMKLWFLEDFVLSPSYLKMKMNSLRG